MPLHTPHNTLHKADADSTDTSIEQILSSQLGS